ncbi:hypothetical protein ACFSTD_05180 [Novosphingobium colocasiae]
MNEIDLFIACANPRGAIGIDRDALHQAQQDVLLIGHVCGLAA